jgi:hypothetical protein
MKQFHRILGSVILCTGFLAAMPVFVNAQGFGTFTLKPGESRNLHIDAADHAIRLCNDAQSAGVMDATIDNHEAHHLAPSDCMEESGSDVAVHNASGGTVKGVYSRMYYLND